jgi:hypothetical protein
MPGKIEGYWKSRAEPVSFDSKFGDQEWLGAP